MQIHEYNDIVRGTSLTIPVIIKRLDDTPLDLTGYRAFFTIKPIQYDYDYDDLRATVEKEILLLSPETGRFDIQLTSKDTWHPPGRYWFDIKLERNGAIAQLMLAQFEIKGTPTNRLVNRSAEPLQFGDAIRLTLTETDTIVIIAPLVSDPPANIIETIIAYPEYLLEELDAPDMPIRNVKIKSFAPKLSMAMWFENPRDALPHVYGFENFFPHNMPDDCPLKGGVIRVDNRAITFELAETLDMWLWDQYTQMEAASPAHKGDFVRIRTNIPYFVGDHVVSGKLDAIIYASQTKYIHITGNYTLPRHHNDPSHWMFRIDYFNKE